MLLGLTENGVCFGHRKKDLYHRIQFLKGVILKITLWRANKCQEVTASTTEIGSLLRVANSSLISVMERRINVKLS